MISLLLALALTPAHAAKASKPAPVVEAPPPAPAAPPADPLDTRPAIGADAAFTPPSPVVSTLSNGADVWVVADKKLPIVTVALTVAGGSATDAPGKEGTAALSDRLLTQGAGALDAATFAQTVEQLGIQLDVSTGKTASTITMSMRSENLDKALDLMADMVLRPAYGKKDYKRERGLAVSDIRVALDELPYVAGRIAGAEWFGADHPYGHPADGTVKGLQGTKLGDVKAYHERAWNAAGASFAIAGDVDPAAVQQKLESRLGAAWPATTSAGITPPPAATHPATTWVMVDKPGSSQTMFYLVFPGLPAGDPALAPVRAGTIVLGGTFTSRLNGLLREQRGYTYGVRAGSTSFLGAGMLTIGTRIRGDATAPAMTDLVGELTKIQAGITAEELGKARGAYKQDQVEAMESRAGVAGTFAALQASGLAPSALQTELADMQGTTVDAVKAAMVRYDLKGAVVVLVGDRAKIEKPLTDAGFGPFVVKPEL